MGNRDSLGQATAAPRTSENLHDIPVAQSHPASGVPGLGPLNIALLVSGNSLQMMKTFFGANPHLKSEHLALHMPHSDVQAVGTLGDVQVKSYLRTVMIPLECVDKAQLCRERFSQIVFSAALCSCGAKVEGAWAQSEGGHSRSAQILC